MKMFYRAVVFLLVAVLTVSMTLQQGMSQIPPKREFRAAWVATVTNLDWPSTAGGATQTQKNELIAVFDGLKGLGFNAIVFQIRPECDALYISSIEPWSRWLTGTQGTPPSPLWDPLEFAVQEAHKRGMELHAWFNPYRAERVVGNYPLASTHVVSQHPDWILYFAPSGSTGALNILNPGLPEVRTHVARVVADIVRRYDVDGIHADDYFYPYPPQTITNQDAATFASYSRGFTNLGDWRRDNVNLLMKQIMDSVNAIKPHVRFGMSPFGIWKNGVPPGITGLDAYSTIYGDAIAWLRDGSVDYFTPQLYWRIGGGQDYSKLMPWWADSVAVHSRHYYPGHIFGSYTNAELPNQLKLARANPKVHGEVYFRATQLNSNSLGFADSLKNTYYKYPALSPVMAWKDPMPPYPPRAIRFARIGGTGPSALLWDLPNTAPDGDSASQYVVYRFDHAPALPGDLSDPRNMLTTVRERQYAPPTGPAGSQYWYTVTALDRNFNESEPSTVLQLNAPATPVLVSPVAGATALPESVSVVWRGSELASWYHLQVSTDSTFAASLLLNDSTLTDTVKMVSGYPGQFSTYWRVRARNAAGASAFSAAFRFTSGIPAVPVLLSPPNVTLDHPVVLSLQWEKAAAATAYRVQLATNALFSPTVLDSAGVTDTVVAAPSLQYYTIYFWRVKATNTFGAAAWTPSFRFRTAQALEVAETPEQPTAYLLSQNFPNPFNPTTQIRFAVPHAGRVVLTVFDLLGREETTLVDSEVPAGTYTVTWDASDAASGMYFYRLRAGDFVETKRMLLLR